MAPGLGNLALPTASRRATIAVFLPYPLQSCQEDAVRTCLRYHQRSVASEAALPTAFESRNDTAPYLIDDVKCRRDLTWP